MCGCRKKNNQTVQAMTNNVMRSAENFEAQSVPDDSIVIQYVGAGSNLLFAGSSTKSRYYFSMGDIAQVNKEDANSFLKLKHGGKNLFAVVKEDNTRFAIEASEIMSELKDIPNDFADTPTPQNPETENESVPESGEEVEKVEDEPIRESEDESEEIEPYPVNLDDEPQEEEKPKARRGRKKASE